MAQQTNTIPSASSNSDINKQPKNNDSEQNQQIADQTEEKYCTDGKGRRVYNITDDGLVKKIMISTNSSGQKVSEHILGRIWINIKGQTANGTVFRDELFEEISLILGQAQESKAIDQALVTMKYGEHAIIEIYDIEKYGYPINKSPAKCPTTNTNAQELPLRYDLIVIDSLPKQEDSHKMTFVQQLNVANVLRQRGNQRYERKRFKTALDIYEKAVQCLEAMDDCDMAMPDQLQGTKVHKNDINACKLKCFLNCAICHRQLKEVSECIKWSSKALEIDGGNMKALIRRGLSYLEQCDFDLARNDMVKFQKLASEDREKRLIKKYLNKIKVAKEKEMEKERKMYAGFLDKKSKKNVSLYDDKEVIKKRKMYDGFLWNIIMVIPNGIMYAFNECTKYCTKRKND